MRRILRPAIAGVMVLVLAQNLWGSGMSPRAQNLLEELRCPVCQNQSVFESDAAMAQDLRALVLEKIDAGWSDHQIQEYLTARYGDYILLRPPVKVSTWMLWLLPFLAMLVGVVVVVRLRRP